ncbi:hypothetical protein [Planctobacterium marinum]|uniref:Uncharacterized protein n=1 Tax=Planctobacterium marinum TaxID=1631968 RepID=A0AA48HF64_9ALTE|nr:hypothetical protein MACH26_07620 [Planctobacterium marinum]
MKMTHQEQFQIKALQLFGELDGAHRNRQDGALLAQRFQKMVEDFKLVQQQHETI